MNVEMRNLVIAEQSWAVPPETAEAQQLEAADVQELDEQGELEHTLSFNYARI